MCKYEIWDTVSETWSVATFDAGVPVMTHVHTKHDAGMAYDICKAENGDWYRIPSVHVPVNSVP